MTLGVENQSLMIHPMVRISMNMMALDKQRKLQALKELKNIPTII